MSEKLHHDITHTIFQGRGCVLQNEQRVCQAFSFSTGPDGVGGTHQSTTSPSACGGPGAGMNDDSVMPLLSPRVALEDRDLWEKFHVHINEMIVTKSGR